ncbi:MAG: response regulator [Candidatus Tumulicola sp.]
MRGPILVADDNPANLHLVLYLLNAFGLEAQGVSDGAAAYEAAKSKRFALVLTDILMPKMDGYELLARMKGDPQLASIPVIAITALAMVGDRERIAAAGFDGYIPKPLEPRTFVTEIEHFLTPSTEG